MTPLRIGFVNALYSRTTERGGLGEHIADLSQELARRGHDCTVITSGPVGEWHEGQVNVVQLGPVEPFSHRAQVLQPEYVLSRLRYMQRLRRYVSKARFDVVEAADGGFEHLVLLRRRACALVTKFHGNFRQFHPQSWLTPIVSALESVTVRGSDAVYASSSVHAEVACRQFKVPIAQIAVIPCGINLGELEGLAAPAIEDRFPQLRGRRLVVLSVGNSPIRKGAPIFLEAAAERDWGNALFVLIVSDVSALAGLRVPSTVVVIPTLQKQVFRQLLAAAAVVALPSTFESFSIATHEAMLLGRAVIISKQVPIDGPARQYPRLSVLDTLDSTALSASIADTLAAPALPASLLTASRCELAAHYGLDAVADATLRLYQAAIARCGTAARPAQK